MERSSPFVDLSLTELCKCQSSSSGESNSHNHDVTHDALLPLPSSLGTLPDRQQHVERYRVLARLALVEALVVRRRLEARERLVGRDGAGVMVEDVPDLDDRQLCAARQYVHIRDGQTYPRTRRCGSWVGRSTRPAPRPSLCAPGARPCPSFCRPRRSESSGGRDRARHAPCSCSWSARG